jgi:hypothetical protein
MRHSPVVNRESLVTVGSLSRGSQSPAAVGSPSPAAVGSPSPVTVGSRSPVLVGSRQAAVSSAVRVSGILVVVMPRSVVRIARRRSHVQNRR